MRYVSRYLTEQGDRVHIACGGKEHAGALHEPKWSRQDLTFEGVPVTRIVRNTSRAALDDNYLRRDPGRYALWKELFEEIQPEVVFTVGRGPSLMGDVEQIARSGRVPVAATLIHPDQVCPKGSRLDAWGRGCMRGLDSQVCGACLVRSRGGLPGMYRVLSTMPAGFFASLLSQHRLTARLRTVLLLPRMVIGFLSHWEELRAAVSVFIAHSQAAVELLKANGVPATRIRLSLPGLEPRRLPAKVRRNAGPIRFGFVGRPCAEKGISTLVRAWQLVERKLEAELHVWGDPLMGELGAVESIKALAASDGRVRFHGPFTRELTDSVYDDIDVLVVPSEWFDNCPFVISEAFAAGVPVVGSDFGGIRSMIRHQVDGLLVPMSNVQAWAEALSHLATNRESVQTLTRGVRPPRDAGEHVRELRSVFERLVQQARSLQTEV